MGIFRRSLRSFEKDVRRMIEDNPGSFRSPVWEEDCVTLELSAGPKLQIWKSDDGVFFDMTVASAVKLGKEHGMSPRKVYQRFGFFTSSSFAMRDEDEIFYASAIPADRYSERRLHAVTNRFILQAADFRRILEQWEGSLQGGGR